ncbi:MAG TPA: GAP family protein [Nakamurella sp.]|nr:GAP family protein [Nakamurella sp.]
MGEVIAEVMLLGLAVAASPFPIIPAILLLFTPRARATSLGFLAGWVIGIVVGTGLFIALATAIEKLDEPPTWASWTRMVLGVLLLVLGVLRWRNRRAQQEIPAWMQSIDSISPAKALRLGVLLSAANPKVLLLAGAAGLAIGSAQLTTAGIVLATAAFTVVASSTVALPVLLYAVVGDRILVPLAGLRTWLQENNAAVMSVVITVIGAVLLVKGIGGL